MLPRGVTSKKCKVFSSPPCPLPAAHKEEESPMKRGKKKKSGIHCRKPYTEISIDEFIETFEDSESIIYNVLDWEAGKRIISDGSAVIRIAPAAEIEIGLKSDSYWTIGKGNWKEINAPDFISKYYQNRRLKEIGTPKAVSVMLHME
jgi:hypothetical protein